MEEKFNVVLDSSSAILQPKDIHCSETDAVGAFGKFEVERSAGRLILFLQDRGRGWEGFTISELFEFYKKMNWDPRFMFFGLIGRWFDDSPVTLFSGCAWIDPFTYLVLDDSGLYHVTDLFIRRCAKLND